MVNTKSTKKREPRQKKMPLIKQKKCVNCGYSKCYAKKLCAKCYLKAYPDKAKGKQKVKSAAKNERKKVEADLDRIYSLVIRMEAADDFGRVSCVSCGSNDYFKKLQNGHYASRGCAILKFEETNTHPQCPACNIFRKGNYPEYAIFMLNKYGEAHLRWLHEESHKSISRNVYELEVMLRGYIERFLVQCNRLSYTPSDSEQLIINKYSNKK